MSFRATIVRMTTVEVLDGRAVLVRHGGDELRREAAVLQAVAGPGAPEVVAVEDGDGDEVRLVTAVEPPLLLVGADIGAVAAAVAAVLARAHDAGIVHGPLRDDHLHGRPGAVVVAGWHEAGPGDPTTDVAELGRFVQRHAGSDPVLLALADRALAHEPPAMSALVTAAPIRLPVPRRPSLPVVGLVVAAVVVGTGLLVGSGGTGEATEIPVPTPTTSTTTTSSTTTTTALPASDIRVTGNVVERDGERWTVGQAGDVVVVGNWHCDGDPVPAVLRRTTGRLWVFDGWSAAGEPVAGRVVATLPGTVDLRVEHSERCDRLVAVDAQGVTTAVG